MATKTARAAKAAPPKKAAGKKSPAKQVSAPPAKAVGPGSLVSIDLKLIDESKTNPRKHFDDAALKELAESITTHGVLNAILVRPAGKKYELVAGARRYRASKLAGIKQIPANVRTLDDKQVLEIQVIENLQRSDLTPLDEAESYMSLVKRHGYTADTLAAKIGKSQSYVHKRIQLAKLDKVIKTKLEEGLLPIAHALLLARIPEPDLQVEAWKAMQEYGGAIKPLSVCQGIILEKYMLKIVNAPFDFKDAMLLPKAGACTTCQYRTGNQKELFDDVKGQDICSNISCYEEKTKTWWETAQLFNDNASAPASVKLSLKQCSNLFYEQGGLKGYGTTLMDLGEKCYQSPTNQTFKSMIGSQVRIHFALNPHTFKVHQLAEKKDVDAALRKHPDMQKKPGQSMSAKEREKKEREKRTSLVFQRVRKVLTVEPMKLDEQTRLRMLLVGLIMADKNQSFLTTHGVTGVRYDKVYAGAEQLVAGKTNEQVWQMLYELFMEELSKAYWSEQKAMFLRVATSFGVDLQGVRDSVMQDAVKKQKPAKKLKKGEELPKRDLTWSDDIDSILKAIEPKVAVSGTCIECGCTESNPCEPDGDGNTCHWVNEEKTLCSDCQEANEMADEAEQNDIDDESEDLDAEDPE